MLSYETFDELYHPCVEGYHKDFVLDLDHAQKTDLDPSYLSVQFSPEAVSCGCPHVVLLLMMLMMLTRAKTCCRRRAATTSNGHTIAAS